MLACKCNGTCAGCSQHSQLGLIYVPAAAAAGPAAPIALAAMAIASFLPTILGKIGAGRREADYLTEPGTGAQWILEHQALPAIIDPYTEAKYAGTLTAEYLDGVIAGLEHLRDGFVDYAQQFLRAGPGAIETILHVINDILIPDVRSQYARVSPYVPPPIVDPRVVIPTLPPPTPPATTQQRVIRVVADDTDFTPWILGIVGFVLIQRIQKGR